MLAPRSEAAFIGSACLGMIICVLAVMPSFVEQHDSKKRDLVAAAATEERVE